MNKDAKQFWDDRSKFGQLAGTNDLIAKQIEMKAISSYIQGGTDVLDVGCGNGMTALYLAQNKRVHVDGIDYSEGMVLSANKLAGEMEYTGTLKGSVSFWQDDINLMKPLVKKYDVIYTERMIVNLLTWGEQRKAIKLIFSMLKHGGIYVMCENSHNGLQEINHARLSIGLQPIVAPWHNRYLIDDEILSIEYPGISLEDINYYSSTYYFISRIINAWDAKQQGNSEPDYNSPCNRLALELPPMGNFGQGRIWIWRKKMCDKNEMEDVFGWDE